MMIISNLGLYRQISMLNILKFLICAMALLFPALAAAAPPPTLNPDRELKPSYKYEDSRPSSLPSGHYIKSTSFEIVPYEITVADKYDKVLRRVQENIPAAGFTLNTVNTKTGMITCALQTEKPEDYVDMGITMRVYNQEEFIFPTAAAAVYKLPYVNEAGDFYQVRRVTALNCMATLQLKKLSAHETKVSISISYMFTVQTNYENTAFRKKAPLPENVTINFMTNIEQKLNLGSAADPAWVTPRSKGVLERALLDAAQ